MADATTAAKDRIDRAFAALEHRILELKTRAVPAAPFVDEDLFALAPSDTGEGGAYAKARIAELEAAGRDASDALARAAEQLRRLLAPADADKV
jgi:hypothetical protein